MLRIKLVRTGKKDHATWRVVVVDRTKTGKGRVSDYIGHYNPNVVPKEFVLNMEKFDHWVGVGAQPTDAILRLKGRFIDKTKDYQKLVQEKIYKKKKVEEDSEAPATKDAKAPVEEKDPSPAPASENESDDKEAPAVEEKVEEKKEDDSGDKSEQ